MRSYYCAVMCWHRPVWRKPQRDWKLTRIVIRQHEFRLSLGATYQSAELLPWDWAMKTISKACKADHMVPHCSEGPVHIFDVYNLGYALEGGMSA